MLLESTVEPQEQLVMLLALIAMQGSTVEPQEQLHALIAVQESTVSPGATSDATCSIVMQESTVEPQEQLVNYLL